MSSTETIDFSRRMLLRAISLYINDNKNPQDYYLFLFLFLRSSSHIYWGAFLLEPMVITILKIRIFTSWWFALNASCFKESLMRHDTCCASSSRFLFILFPTRHCFTCVVDLSWDSFVLASFPSGFVQSYCCKKWEHQLRSGCFAIFLIIAYYIGPRLVYQVISRLYIVVPLVIISKKTKQTQSSRIARPRAGR